MVHSACLVTPGSKNRANDHEGSPGNLGDPAVSTEQAGRRYRQPNSRMIHGSATGADGDEQGVLTTFVGKPPIRASRTSIHGQGSEEKTRRRLLQRNTLDLDLCFRS